MHRQLLTIRYNVCVPHNVELYFINRELNNALWVVNVNLHKTLKSKARLFSLV